MGSDTEIHIDRNRPPRLTLDDTGGEPILAVELAHADRLPGRQVSLRAERGLDGNSYYLDATLEHDGSLTFSGQNLGPSIGYDGEYEYWVTVKASDVPALVTALGGEDGEDVIEVLLRNWTGAAASRIGDAIDTAGIAHNFVSYY